MRQTTQTTAGERVEWVGYLGRRCPIPKCAALCNPTTLTLLPSAGTCHTSVARGPINSETSKKKTAKRGVGEITRPGCHSVGQPAGVSRG